MQHPKSSFISGIVLLTLTACSSSTATPTTTTVVTTTVAPVTIVAPTTTPPTTTLALTTTNAPSSTKSKTNITGNRDKDYVGARAMLAKLHDNFYEDGDIIVMAAAFDRIEAKYATYNAKVGTTLTGYYLQFAGTKYCYLANDNSRDIADTAC